MAGSTRRWLPPAASVRHSAALDAEAETCCFKSAADGSATLQFFDHRIVCPSVSASVRLALVALLCGSIEISIRYPDTWSVAAAGAITVARSNRRGRNAAMSAAATLA